MEESNVRVSLCQESGVSGPSATLRDIPEDESAEWHARRWADGQTGHPWDFLTMEFPNGEKTSIRLNYSE